MKIRCRTVHFLKSSGRVNDDTIVHVCSKKKVKKLHVNHLHIGEQTFAASDKYRVRSAEKMAQIQSSRPVNKHSLPAQEPLRSTHFILKNEKAQRSPQITGDWCWLAHRWGRSHLHAFISSSLPTAQTRVVCSPGPVILLLPNGRGETCLPMPCFLDLDYLVPNRCRSVGIIILGMQRH